MLAPLDGVQINAFLDELPQRTELSQESYSVPHRVQDVVDLALGREPSDSKSDAAVRALITIAKRSEHVARFERCGRAGAARGQCNIF